jgi:hypothetical protein
MKEQKYRLVSVGFRYDRPMLDVVFVHGLTGGPYTTWNGVRDEPEVGETFNGVTTNFEPFDSECAGEKYWPSWLDEDLRKDRSTSINLWSLGYAAPLLSRDDPLGYPESLRTGVRPLVLKLVLANIAASDQTRLVFIGHSLGGLMIKAALDYSERSADPAERRLVERCVGVAFLGTPHAGSGLASLLANLDGLLDTMGTGARVLSWIAGAPLIGSAINTVAKLGGWFAEPSNQVQWLQKAGADLRELAEEYRSIAARRGLSTRAFYETQPLKGLPPKRLMWIVDASNADPGVTGCRPAPAPGADHVGICKPSRDSITHEVLRAWIRDLAQAADRGTGRPWLRDELDGVLERIAHLKPAIADAIRPTPRSLEEIPIDVRTPFSHEFRDRIDEMLEAGLAKRIENDRDLVSGLARSDWDLDRLVLMHWLSHNLAAVFRMVDGLLRQEASSFDRHVGSGVPSLIPTFRLLDGFREALVTGAADLREAFQAMHDAIESSHAHWGDTVDGNGRTRRLLTDGLQILEKAQTWRKPPK